MAKTMNTVKVIASWMIFSWNPVNAPNPRRLAGTARQYSTRAINQDTKMAFHNGHVWPYLRCPYQAKVMKTLEKNSKAIVRMGYPIPAIFADSVHSRPAVASSRAAAVGVAGRHW